MGDAIFILNGIEYSLFETKKMKRKQLKIRVDVSAKVMFNPKDLIISATRIILMLESFRIDDFMFIFDLWLSDECILEEAAILEELQGISSNVTVSLENLCFVISKKD